MKRKGGGKGEKVGVWVSRGSSERTARDDERPSKLRCQHQNNHKLSVGEKKRG